MSEKPIIFKGPMVRAILDGTKTQTRRLNGIEKINVSPNKWSGCFMRHNGAATFTDNRERVTVDCPYGDIGGTVWVRENLVEGRCGSDYNHIAGYQASTKDSLPDMRFFQDAIVRRNGKTVDWWDFFKDKEKRPRKVVPSIHMPRWASRINLTITDIRIERLQDISGPDACAEGIDLSNQHDSYVPENQIYVFSKLWDSINAKKHPWASNPYVWALSFKQEVTQ